MFHKTYAQIISKTNEVCMKISVCMIVKNEEDVLERILQKAVKFADEIVVVDTGSSDNTKSIARKYTERVYDYKWCDDFSKARNYSFSLATYEYIMWLDADDYIEDEEINKILLLKDSKGDFDIYMCKYQIAFDENNKPTFEYYRERIVKNSPRFRWRGFVHESIGLSGKITYTDIAIKHKKIHPTTPRRNLDLYEKHIAKGHRLNARETFYYARELYFNNLIDKSITQFNKFLKKKNTYRVNAIDAHLMLSKCYISKGDYTRAKNVLIDSIKLDIPNSQISCALGSIAEHENKISESIFWFSCATLTPPNLKSGAFIERDYFDFIPYVSLSVLYYKLGDHEKFCYYHNLAKQIKPNSPVIIQNDKFI